MLTTLSVVNITSMQTALKMSEVLKEITYRSEELSVSAQVRSQFIIYLLALIVETLIIPLTVEEFQCFIIICSYSFFQLYQHVHFEQQYFDSVQSKEIQVSDIVSAISTIQAMTITFLIHF